MANGNMQGMGMMAPPAQPMQEQASMPVVDMNSFQQSFSNLSDESNKVLEQHLTQPLKKVFAELFGQEVVQVMKDIGPTEATVNVPVTTIVAVYPAATIEESIQMMGQDFASKAQQNIPNSPQGGLGGGPMMDSPQTNVPPGPMPKGII